MAKSNKEWEKHPMTISLANMLGVTPQKLSKLSPKEIDDLTKKTTPQQTWISRRL